MVDAVACRHPDRTANGRIASAYETHELIVIARRIARAAAAADDRRPERVRQRDYDAVRDALAPDAPSASATCQRLGLSWRALLREIEAAGPGVDSHASALRGRARPRSLLTAAETDRALRATSIGLGARAFGPREYDEAAARREDMPPVDRVRRSLRGRGADWDDGLEHAGLDRRPAQRANAPGVAREHAIDMFIEQMGAYPGEPALLRWARLTGVRVQSRARTAPAGETHERVARMRARRGLPTPRPHRGGHRIDWSRAAPLAGGARTSGSGGISIRFSRGCAWRSTSLGDPGATSRSASSRASRSGEPRCLTPRRSRPSAAAPVTAAR